MSIFDKPEAPPAPDYAAAATAQGSANVDAARVTGKLNRPDEYNPFGSRVWSDLGGDRFRVDTSFTPTGAALFDKDLQQKLRLSNLGDTAMGNVENTLSKPADFSQNRDAIVDAMYRRSTRLLDPQYAQGEDRTRTDLVNRGFSLNDKGYTDAMDNFTRNKDSAYADARDRATTGGAQQAITEMLAERNLPMQELNAIRTGAMPQTPNFQNYANTGPVGAAPVFAAAQAQGNTAQQQYGNEVSTYNNMMSGLASLGSAWLRGPV